MRARPAAGDRKLGEDILRSLEPFIWRRSMDFGILGDLTRMAERIRRASVGRTSAPGGDLKRGRGGIREVEFFVQAHQLIHGGRDRSLRSPNLLTALESLVSAGHIDGDEASGLSASYRFLRTIEHRLQMVDDRQTHSLPTNHENLEGVAHLHGSTDAERLLAELETATTRVAASFDKLQTSDGRLSDVEAALGRFPDGEAARRTVEGWRSGTVPCLRSDAAQTALEDLLPTLLASFAEADEPLTALHRFDDIVRRMSSAVNLFRLLEANRPIARLLADTIAAAPVLAAMLADRPELLDRLLDTSALQPLPPSDGWEARWWGELARLSYEQALDQLRMRVIEERFAIGVRFIAGTSSPAQLSRDYADVAEVAVRLAHALAAREFERAHGAFESASLVVVALGRLGGRALTHASDLDLILLYDAPAGQRSTGERSHDPSVYFGRLGQRFVSALSLPTSAGPLYDVDTRLRPSGEQGPLVPSVQAFERYGSQEAWVWERMALLRARVISGSAAARRRVETALIAIRTPRGDGDHIRSEAAAMRARLDRSKPPSGDLDVKMMPGGLVDLEFIVQVEQLISGVTHSPILDVALAELVAADRVDAALVGAARTLADLLFVFRLTAPDGELRSDSAVARSWSALQLANMDELRGVLAEARATVRTQWHRTFNARRDD